MSDHLMGDGLEASLQAPGHWLIEGYAVVQTKRGAPWTIHTGNPVPGVTHWAGHQIGGMFRTLAAARETVAVFRASDLPIRPVGTLYMTPNGTAYRVTRVGVDIWADKARVDYMTFTANGAGSSTQLPHDAVEIWQPGDALIGRDDRA